MTERPLMDRLHPMRSSRMAWSEQTSPPLALLALLSAALKESGAEDAGRATNPWYRMERTLADSTAQVIESWRVMKDLGAELMFERIYAA